MNDTMNKKEQALAKKIGAKLVLKGLMNKYIACFDEKCIIGFEKALLQKEISSDFSYKNIRQVTLVPCGLSSGYIYLNVGGGDTPNIVSNNNPNAVVFRKKGDNMAKEIKSFLELKMNEQSISSQNVVVELSGADELKKYAELKEQGIISQEEFDAKKKELLGL